MEILVTLAISTGCPKFVQIKLLQAFLKEILNYLDPGNLNPKKQLQIYSTLSQFKWEGQRRVSHFF
jgi:hypothetical protein